MKALVKTCLRLLRNICDPLFNFREVSILCYHRYDPHLSDHLAALKARGYTFVALTDVVAWAKKQKDIPRKSVAVTFDDGYPDFATQVLPVLRQYGAPVTLFAVGTFDTTPLRGDVLLELGYHTKTHPNLAKLTEQEIVTEVAPPHGEQFFAYPGGNHSPETRAAARAAGYEAAFGIRPVPVQQGMDLYLLPRSVITPEMTTNDVLFYVSHAATWYYALKQFA